MNAVTVTLTAEQAKLAAAVLDEQARHLYRDIVNARPESLGLQAANENYLNMCAVWDAFESALKVAA